MFQIEKLFLGNRGVNILHLLKSKLLVNQKPGLAPKYSPEIKLIKVCLYVFHSRSLENEGFLSTCTQVVGFCFEMVKGSVGFISTV